MSTAVTRTQVNRASYEDWLEYVSSIDLPAGDGRLKVASGSHGLAWPIGGLKIHFMPVPQDVLVQCPKCKVLETLQFVEDTLTPCRKFTQKDGKIYHDCGSDLPCHLHR